jgi:glycosyltransferase involved in cell wall biosynthesis
LNKDVIVHYITGLGSGGAEGILLLLAENDEKYTHKVVSLSRETRNADQFRSKGIETFCIDYTSILTIIISLIKICSLPNKYKAVLIQTWMYHADFFAIFLKMLYFSKPVVWGVRNTAVISKNWGASKILMMKLLAICSRIVPSRIICCSENSIKGHIQRGYSASKFFYIPNGVDTKKFIFSDKKRLEVRKNLQIAESEFVIGMVARWDYYKDHLTLLKSVSNIKNKNRFKFKLVLVGNNIESSNETLVNMIESLGLKEEVILTGNLSNVSEVYSSFDLMVLSSKGEAFPNVVVESMSCEIPVVASNVGDVKSILENSGEIVDVSNAYQMEESIEKMHKEFSERKNEYMLRKKKIRDIVVNKYSISRMVDNYHKCWQEVMG